MPSLTSIAVLASGCGLGEERLDLLINNAGVMVPPRRQEPMDGFELQLGTNYLGHFALTGQLLPLLRKGGGPRGHASRASPRASRALDFGRPECASGSYRADAGL